MRIVKVKQRDITDCGAACLSSVAAFHGLDIPVARIRQLASTDQRGTNVLGLIEAASKLGLDAKGVRGQIESLAKIPLPAIAHVIVNNALHHYQVIYRVTASFVEVMDPGDGSIQRIKLDDFKESWTGVLVLLWPTEKFKPSNSRPSVRSRFWQLMKPHRGILLQTLFGAFVYTVIGLSTSIYVQKIVDYVFVDGNHNLLHLMGVIMILLLFFQIFIGTTKSIFMLRTGQLIDAGLVIGYYKHLMKLPQQFFDTMRIGEVMTRVSDAVKIRVFINDVMINLAVNMFIVIAALGLMFTYYWKLALVILASVPVYVLVYFISNRLNKKAERSLMENAAEMETQLVESLNNINTINVYNIAGFVTAKTEVRFAALLRSVHKSGINTILAGSVTEFFSKLSTILLLWVGAGFVLDHKLTPGELLSFYALINYFTGPVGSLIGMNKSVQSAIVAADRLFEIIDLEVDNDAEEISLSPEVIGDIDFTNVQFRYGSRTLVFTDLSMKVKKSSVTAIVGESGCGKSTLASILYRAYPTQSGNVRIGANDIKHIKRSSLRKLIGLVPQKIDLFAGTVVENIAIGETKPDIERIQHICVALGMDFIEKLPSGYATFLGENGFVLSWGQRQRMGIARALYRNPGILILDEATSSLDSHSERFVHETINKLRREKKTVILIAHRLSTAIHADKIVVLGNGVALEEGTHSELMSLRGHYYSLWQNQFPQ
ncbi:MAG: peptidase domain-containing ABC transporter [Bacteroidota bacterium]